MGMLTNRPTGGVCCLMCMLLLLLLVLVLLLLLLLLLQEAVVLSQTANLQGDDAGNGDGDMLSHNVNFQLGMVYARRGLLAPAIMQYKNALFSSPQNETSHFNLGALLVTIGKVYCCGMCYNCKIPVGGYFQHSIATMVFSIWDHMVFHGSQFFMIWFLNRVFV